MLQGRQGNVRTFSSGHPCTTTTRETSQRGWMLSKQKGYWKHETHPISFTLCVDDFGVKYVGAEHFQHLPTSLNKHYLWDIDWHGRHKIPWINFGLGLRKQGRTFVYAGLCPWRSCTILTHSTTKTTASTTSTHRAKVQINQAIYNWRRHITIIRWIGQKIVQEVIGSYIIHAQLMQQCYQPLEQWKHSKPIQLRTQWKKWYNLVKHQHILMPLSNTEQVIRYW